MDKNLDLVWGVNEGDEGNLPDRKKYFLMANTKSKIIQHECLYEGISSYKMTSDHAILCQIHLKDGKHYGKEDSPYLNKYSNYSPKIKLTQGQKVWKFIKLNRFIELIESSNIHFARIDQFKDNLEGISPETCKKAIEESERIKTDRKLENLKFYYERLQNNRKICFATCWYIDDKINYKMWKEYGGNNDSIAIQTNFNSLNKVFKKSKVPIINEPIRYFNDPYFNQEAYWFPTFFKRMKFNDEKELRSVLFFPGEINPEGVKIEVDLEQLITKIHIHPKSTKEHFYRIKDLIKEKGLKIQVVKK